MNPTPYIPRPWQLPHLLAAPIGGTVLMVERYEEQPPPLSDGFEWEIKRLGKWFEVVATRHHDEGLDHPAAKEEHLWERLGCPIGPIGTVLSIEGVGDFRTTCIDVRRVDTMTESEALAWGVDRQWTSILGAAEVIWECDNPGAKWGDWAWFITAERVERA